MRITTSIHFPPIHHTCMCPVLSEALAHLLPPVILKATSQGGLSSTTEETEMTELHNVSSLVTKSQSQAQAPVPQTHHNPSGKASRKP